MKVPPQLPLHLKEIGILVERPQGGDWELHGEGFVCTDETWEHVDLEKVDPNAYLTLAENSFEAPRDVMAFVKQFGALEFAEPPIQANDDPHYSLPPPFPSRQVTHNYSAAPFFYEQERRKLASLIELWDAVASKNYAHLKNRVRWKRHAVYVDGKKVSEIIPTGRLLAPARVHLTSQITDAIRPVKIDVAAVPPNREQILISANPRDLRSALYLQFANAIYGGELIHRCPYCRKRFTPNTKRAKYCSTRCNTYFNRKRSRANAKHS